MAVPAKPGKVSVISIVALARWLSIRFQRWLVLGGTRPIRTRRYSQLIVLEASFCTLASRLFPGIRTDRTGGRARHPLCLPSYSNRCAALEVDEWKAASKDGQWGGLQPLCRRRRPTVQPVAGDRSCQIRSEEHTSELQSLMRISYAVFCLKKKNTTQKL